MKEKLGSDGFIWWVGEVVNIDDPLKLGRCQIKIFDWYDSDDIDSADFPWAQPVQPITSAAHNQIGRSPTGLLVGSWVVGFFMDAHEAQRPMIMGSIAAVQNQSSLGQVEPDVHRLARNDEPDEQDYTPELIETKNGGLTKDVPTALDAGDTWSEPEYAYDAKYPDNHVLSTKSGHVKEYDDTDGAERIHEYHKSGTFYEIDADGNKVTRIVGDDYVIVASNNYVNIKGSCHLTIDTDCHTYVKGDWNIQVDGNKTELIKGKLDQTVNDTVTETYKNDQFSDITGTRRTTASVEIDDEAPIIMHN